MAQDNIKDFTLDWILFGFLVFAMLSFTVTFFVNNNPGGLGNAEEVISSTSSSLQTKLLKIPTNTDALLNITAKTNPEASQLGSRDSVATSYGFDGEAKGFFESTKELIAFVFTGTAGTVILAVLGGIIGLLGLYFIIKFVRIGA